MYLAELPWRQEGSLVFSLFSLIKLHLASLPLASSYSRVAVSSVFWAQDIYFSAQTRGAPLTEKFARKCLLEKKQDVFKEKSERISSKPSGYLPRQGENNNS